MNYENDMEPPEHDTTDWRHDPTRTPPTAPGIPMRAMGSTEKRVYEVIEATVLTACGVMAAVVVGVIAWQIVMLPAIVLAPALVGAVLFVVAVRVVLRLVRSDVL